MKNYSIGEFAKKVGVSVQTLRNWHKNGELIQIVTVFSCGLQGNRANKAKKMLKELMENDTSQ